MVDLRVLTDTELWNAIIDITYERLNNEHSKEDDDELGKQLEALFDELHVRQGELLH